MLGYLFYVGDRRRPTLPYREPRADATTGSGCAASRALTPDAIVGAGRGRAGALRLRATSSSRAACWPVEQEIEAMAAPSPSASRRPASLSTRTAAGSLAEADRLLPRPARRARLRRGPGRRPRAGSPGREVMAEFRRATGLPTATNMIATDWRQLGPRHPVGRGRHPAGRPALLDDAGSVRVAQLCDDCGLHLGIALEQPLRHLAGDVHPRRRGRTRATSPPSTRTGSGRTGRRSPATPLQIRDGQHRRPHRARSRGRARPGRPGGGARAIPGARPRRPRRRRGDAVPRPRLDVRPQAPVPGPLTAALAPPERHDDRHRSRRGPRDPRPDRVGDALVRDAAAAHRRSATPRCSPAGSGR